MENSEQPAHPAPYQSQYGTIYHDVYLGLTKREYFAAMAMQGLLASWHNFEKIEKAETLWLCEHIANISTTMAECLLTELEK
jgi:hypothetical protein